MSKIKTLMRVLKESNKHMKNWGGSMLYLTSIEI